MRTDRIKTPGEIALVDRMLGEVPPAVRPTTPQAVSAVLRKAGWVPTPRSREGVHITRSHRAATVSCDWDSPRQSREQAALMVEVLEAAGYVVEVHSNPALLTVSGRAV